MNNHQSSQSSNIKVTFTHSILSNRIPEFKLSTNKQVIDVKMILERKFGSYASTMTLQLQNKDGLHVCDMLDDYQPVSSYGIQDGNIIHCIDEDPHSIVRNLENFEMVEKYKISDEDYNKLPMNAKKFKNKLKKNNPDLFVPKGDVNVKGIIIDPDYLQKEANEMNIGDRCEIKKDEQRGEVKYIGKIPYMGEGYFVGIQVDEPCGKNNGSFKAVKYFECLPKYGIFVRPDDLNVGDYPELDIDEI
uniref:Tubulin-specific chaperone B n=1 Tax=Lepeophtheirus salmonis TaxID=72036 RepID=D3PH54_LEPSM|nr:Tubulin-specific chaperone B [Lepeophtheirus salmonis]